MDFRIGAKSTAYAAGYASKAAARSSNTSFAGMMQAEVESINEGRNISGASAQRNMPTLRDTVMIHKKPSEGDVALPTASVEKTPLTERLESVRKRIEAMDFTGKSPEEAYKAIVDSYEEEFGFLSYLFEIDKEGYNAVKKDREAQILAAMEGMEPKPDEQTLKSNEFYCRAMGYDKMTKEEKIAAIRERVGGDSYCHRYAELAELRRVGLITPEQHTNMYSSLRRRSILEYCEANGLDYMRYQYPWDYGENASLEDMNLRDSRLTAWASGAEVTWSEILESVRNNPALYGWEKSAIFDQLDETLELLLRGDKARKG